jgi:hypothetical protein
MTGRLKTGKWNQHRVSFLIFLSSIFLSVPGFDFAEP